MSAVCCASNLAPQLALWSADLDMYEPCSRCGAILFDSLLCQAPCSEGSATQPPGAMEVDAQSAGQGQMPLLTSHVEAFCDTVVDGMKVDCIALHSDDCCTVEIICT